jgi:hypothetical protein
MINDEILHDNFIESSNRGELIDNITKKTVSLKLR